jgi:hypothetical protein
MAAPAEVKNAINIWMNTICGHARQALNEFTTASVIKELSPSGTVTFIDTVTSTGACFFPIMSNAKQIVIGLSIQALKMGVQPPDPGNTGALAFQVYGRQLLNRSVQSYATNLHNVADYRWTAERFHPFASAFDNPNSQQAHDVQEFTEQLLQSTFKPGFIVNAKNGTFNGNAITTEVKSSLRRIYDRVKKAENLEQCMRLPGICVPPSA